MESQTFSSEDTLRNLDRYKNKDSIYQKQLYTKRLIIWIERFSQQPVGPEKELLEIGVGSGETLCCLAPHFCTSGLEPSPIFIEHARTKASKRNLMIDLRKGAAEDTPFAFAGKQFDIILMLSVLEHVFDYKGALANVFEHLRPGGIFIFNTTNKFSLIQGEYNFPPFFYSYLPNKWRFDLRRRFQGEGIMDHGIDFHQFIPWRLKSELFCLGFQSIVNLLEIMVEEDIVSPKSRFFFRKINNSLLLSFLYRIFFSDIFYFCKK